MSEVINEKAKEELEKGYFEANEILKNEDKFEKFLQRLEKKLKCVPIAGEKLSYVPVFASLIKSYVKKEYIDIPLGTIISIISALIYYVSPFDIIPDGIPFLGLADDAAVIAFCWTLVETDVEEYITWREKNGKIIMK